MPILILQLILALAFYFVFGTELHSDSARFVYIADAFSKFNFSDPIASCNTALGYPVFLAIFRIFTHSTAFVVGVQAVVFGFAVQYVAFGKGSFRKTIQYCLKGEAWTFKHLRTWPIGVFVVLLCLAFPYTHAQVLSESVLASCIVLAIPHLVISNRSDLFKLCLLCLCIGSLRYEYLSFVAIPIGIAIFHKWQKTRQSSNGSPSFKLILLLLSFPILIVFGITSIRNHIVFDEFKPLNFGSGTVMFGGNNSNGDAMWHVYFTTPNYIDSNALTQLQDPYCDYVCLCKRQDSIFKTLAINHIKSKPAELLYNFPLKLAHLWLYPSNIEPYTSNASLERGILWDSLWNSEFVSRAGKLKHIVYLTSHLVCFVLLFFGFWRSFKQSENGNTALIISLIWIIGLSVLYATIFYGIGRFHIPLLACMCGLLCFKHSLITKES